MKTLFDVPAQRTGQHDDLEVAHSRPQPHDLPKLSPAGSRARRAARLHKRELEAPLVEARA